MYQIAVVEDEPTEGNKLCGFITRYAEKNNVSIQARWYGHVMEFLESYQGQFDLIFMDIQMPVLNGMEAARKLREKDEEVPLLFVTNLAQYAIQGYSVGAYDYILKPVGYVSLEMRLRRALRFSEKCRTQTVLIETEEGTRRLPVSDLYYVEVFEHHIRYQTAQGCFFSYGNLKKIEQSLPEGNFFRCNNQTVVNLNSVTEMQGDEILVNGRRFDVSRRRKAEFMESLHRCCVKL